jgi:hypothetical protein
MEVIVVIRDYFNWDDSYTKILGVCISEEKADELIEMDKHKDNHPKMDKILWLDINHRFFEFKENLIKHENGGKKKGGFLGRFHYDGLNKVAKHAYDELKKKYDGRKFDEELWYEMNDEDTFYLLQIFDKSITKLSFEDYQELDKWYTEKNHYENPEHIHYKKEKFEVI